MKDSFRLTSSRWGIPAPKRTLPSHSLTLDATPTLSPSCRTRKSARLVQNGESDRWCSGGAAEEIVPAIARPSLVKAELLRPRYTFGGDLPSRVRRPGL